MVIDALEADIITPENAFTLKESILFEHRRGDIFEWNKHYFPDRFGLPFCKDLHGFLVDIRDEPNRAILAPRSHAKTTFACFAIPIYQAYNEPDKYKLYLNIQATTRRAIDINLSIRDEIENNELLEKDYGNVKNPDKWTEKMFYLTNGVMFMCAGAGEAIRGTLPKGRRPDYVIVDDIYKEDHIFNPELVRKMNRWFWSTVFKMMANDRKTCIHVQGTAINKEDLMHTLSDSDRWISKKFKSVLDWEKGTVLWPENKNTNFEQLLLDRDDMGDSAFFREMQNEIRDDEDAIIQQSWVQWYEAIPEDEQIVKTIAFCDPAIGEKQTNDYTAISICFITNNGSYYFEEVYQYRKTIHESLKEIFRLQKIYNIDEFRVETQAAFIAFAQEIKRHNQMVGTNDWTFKAKVRLVEIKALKDKKARLEGVQAKFQTGQVFFNKFMPVNIKETIQDQLTVNYPVHDDIRDSIVGCLENTKRKPKFKVIQI